MPHVRLQVQCDILETALPTSDGLFLLCYSTEGTEHTEGVVITEEV